MFLVFHDFAITIVKEIDSLGIFIFLDFRSSVYKIMK